MRLGMDFGGTNFKVGIFSEKGRAISFAETDIQQFCDKGDVLQNLIDHVKRFIQGHKITMGGLAIKGLVNTNTGIMVDDIGAGALFAGRDLQKAFAEAVEIPFVVENDARAYAWGEWLFGAGQGTKVMVCMTLGTGLGCALVVDGKPYQGANLLGGILGGHITIDRNGPECPCGHRGCLELYCSATALSQRVREAHPEFNQREDVLPAFSKALEQQREPYQQTLYAFQHDLALGIVNVIHAFGPDMVVLGGGVMNSSHLILPELTKLVHKRAWTVPRKTIKIRAAQLGNKAAALGVAFHPKLKGDASI